MGSYAVEVELGGVIRRLSLDANAIIAMKELTGNDMLAELAAFGSSAGDIVGKLKGLKRILFAMSVTANPAWEVEPARGLQEVGAWFSLADVPRIAELLAPVITSALEMPKEFPEQMAPFVPSPAPIVEAMVEMAALKDGEYAVDLGAGDGRLMLRAAEAAYGVKVDGYELHEGRYNALRLRLANHKLAGLLTVFRQDIRTADLSGVGVVFLYLLPGSNAELKAKLLAELQPGARIISHDFAMPEWEPELVRQVQCEDRMRPVYRWIVPERADVGANG